MKAHEWLLKVPPKYWARCFYGPRAKTNRMVNNLSESFKNAIKQVRDKPILSMMEGLRMYIIQRYVERAKFVTTFKSKICPSICKKLDIEKDNAMEYAVIYCATQKFEISSPLKSWIVDIGLRTCSCRKWDVTGIPCKHACAAIRKDRSHPEDFISQYFLTETFRQSYAYLINPIPDKSMWIQTEYDDIMPPPYRRRNGKPKKSRRKGDDELTATIGRIRVNVAKCRKCNQARHNARTCNAEVSQSSTTADVVEANSLQVIVY